VSGIFYSQTNQKEGKERIVNSKWRIGQTRGLPLQFVPVGVGFPSIAMLLALET